MEGYLALPEERFNAVSCSHPNGELAPSGRRRSGCVHSWRNGKSVCVRCISFIRTSLEVTYADPLPVLRQQFGKPRASMAEVDA